MDLFVLSEETQRIIRLAVTHNQVKALNLCFSNLWFP